jgi:hypothetical protein
MTNDASEKKLIANQANAQKSTGPKTKKGKENSRDNSIKHGAYATRRLIRGEDKELYDAIRLEQSKIFKPKTFVEKALVDQLVGDLWTLRRIARAENMQTKSVISEMVDEVSKADDEYAAGSDGQVIVPNPSDVYERQFFWSSNQMALEKVTSFKRQIIANILALERELERRRRNSED